jgi:hypothetical protein
MIKQRTINNMKPKQQARARRLWEIMQDTFEGEQDFILARDAYHAMFKHDANFVAGTEEYTGAV